MDFNGINFSDKEIQEYKQSVINKLFAILGIFEDCEAINDYSGYTAYIKRLTREFNGLYNMFGIVNFLSVVTQISFYLASNFVLFLLRIIFCSIV